MIKCITLNGDGSIAYFEEYPKRFRPILGWERKRDGSFYKTLGDPRCISHERAKAAIAEMQRQAKERENSIIPFREPTPPKKRMCSVIRQTPNWSTVKAKTKIMIPNMHSESQIMSAFDNYSVCLVNGDTQYAGPIRTKKCCINSLNTYTSYRKIVIRSYINLIEVWFFGNNSEQADLGIIGAIDDNAD